MNYIITSRPISLHPCTIGVLTHVPLLLSLSLLRSRQAEKEAAKAAKKAAKKGEPVLPPSQVCLLTKHDSLRWWGLSGGSCDWTTGDVVRHVPSCTRVAVCGIPPIAGVRAIEKISRSRH